MNMQAVPPPAAPIKTFSRPVFYESVLLQTPIAHRIVDRVLTKTIRSLYATTVIMPIIADEAASDRLAENIGETLSGTGIHLGRQKQMLEALKKERMITRVPSYTAPRKIDVEITSPLAASYLELVSRADEIGVLIDTLWFGCAFTNNQMKKARWKLQGHMMLVGTRIISLERRARAAAARKGKEAEAVRLAGPETTDIAELPNDESATTDAPVDRVTVSDVSADEISGAASEPRRRTRAAAARAGKEAEEVSTTVAAPATTDTPEQDVAARETATAEETAA